MDIREMRLEEVEAVFDLWNANCVAAVGTPLSENNALNVRSILQRYPESALAACFVAMSGKRMIGFVTCAILEHPVLLGRSGEIEELGVVPSRGRTKVAAALVLHAAAYLKKQGVLAIRTSVANDQPNDKRFWRKLGWDNDMTIFSFYASVPGDPVLQAVWNNY